MATERRAEVRWQGSLLEGSGTIDSTTSGAVGGLGVTWKARSEDEHGGLTSPEELIAAAHAACFSMALSGALARADTPAEELRTAATVTFQPPFRSAGCSCCSTRTSHARPVRRHSKSSASSSLRRSPDGSCMSGSATST